MGAGVVGEARSVRRVWQFRLSDASLLPIFLSPPIMSDPVSTRVTSTRLQDYVGQSVRLVAKTLRVRHA